MISKSEQRKIEFQLATSKDASEMINFHNSYYKTSRKPEHWLWEYGTYEPEKTVFAFAKDRDKIIGTQAMLPIYMEVGSERVLSGKSENTLLLPPYRGSGIMPSLYEYAVKNCVERGMQFIWGFTRAVKAFRNFGFTCYPCTQTMVRPGNLLIEIASRLKIKAPYWFRIGSAGKSILRSIFVKHSIPTIEERLNYEIRAGLTNEHDLQNLYKRLKQKHKYIISIKLDQKYLKWRIREHPFLKYDEYQVYQGDMLRAYAFITLFEGVVSISGLTSEDEYATSLLLHRILTHYNRKAGRFQFLCNPADYLAQNVLARLHQFGFRPNRSEGNIVLLDLTGSKNKQILDMRNWHINGLWTEGYSM